VKLIPDSRYKITKNGKTLIWVFVGIELDSIEGEFLAKFKLPGGLHRTFKAGDFLGGGDYEIKLTAEGGEA
jgi:hypothetical protein